MKVDVKAVIAQKNPSLARFTPLVNWLRRVVHEDEVNTYLTDFADLPSIEFARATLRRMQITTEVHGLDKIDTSGRYLFASNHPFGGLDGLMLADKIGARFGDARVIVNDLLMNLDPLKGIFIPINKHGRQNPEYATLYNEAFESDMPIITFPAGLCSRKRRGQVADLTWKHNFVKRAIATQRDIVPVFFEGRLSNFFYRLSNLRTSLGIGANIEMLYLPDEMFKQKGKHFNMIVGEPIPWKSLRARKPSEAALEIRRNAYNLQKNRQG